MIPYPYLALVENGTNILLTIGTFSPAMVFLGETILDTHYVPSVNFPNYIDSFPIATLSPETYSQWTWKGKTRLFVSTRPELAKAALERSLIATYKYNAISQVMQVISNMRLDVNNGVSYQETVYMDKRSQAQQFKAAGFPEAEVDKYPYIAQYAQFANTTPKIATEGILIKSRMDEEVLTRTELLRLRYFKKIREAKTKDSIEQIVLDLLRDNGANALS